MAPGLRGNVAFQHRNSGQLCHDSAGVAEVRSNRLCEAIDGRIVALNKSSGSFKVKVKSCQEGSCAFVL